MPEVSIEWAAAAQADLRAIALHIARDSVDNALAVVDRLQRRAEALGNLPQRGRVVPELERVGERRFRELIEPPWRIIYLPQKNHVYVVAVVDSRRALGDWLEQQAARFSAAATLQGD